MYIVNIVINPYQLSLALKGVYKRFDTNSRLIPVICIYDQSLRAGISLRVNIMLVHKPLYTFGTYIEHSLMHTQPLHKV